MNVSLSDSIAWAEPRVSNDTENENLFYSEELRQIQKKRKSKTLILELETINKYNKYAYSIFKKWNE